MPYEPKTERIDLGNGDHASLYVDFRHGTQKATNLLTWPALIFPEGESPKIVNDGDKFKFEGSKPTGIDWAMIDWDTFYDEMIIGQVKEWSFGPVDHETLDALPVNIRASLVKQVDRLYGEISPLAKGGGGN